MSYEALPESLKNYPHWCVWKRDAEHGKIPFDPRTGRPARSNDVNTFCDFATANNALSNNQYAGLGIGLFGDVSVIDIDHCMNEGHCSEEATDIINTMDSYAEVSPSGTGIHIVFTTREFEYDKTRYYINNHKKGLEVYISGVTNKFITITGNRFNDNPITDCTDKLPVILECYMRRNSDAVTLRWEDTGRMEVSKKKDYLTIGLEKDEKLKRLWYGERPKGNESEDDAAFMAKLLYWTNNDSEEAIKAFLSSPYAGQKDEKHKKKLERKDYLPNLAVAMRAGKTAAEEDEVWQKSRSKTQSTAIPKQLEIISAEDLQAKSFPPTRHLVYGLLPEGMTIIASAPKVGKSWFVLQMGLKIAAGEPFLDRATSQAGVLYLSFEDRLARLQARMNSLLGKVPPPEWFYFSTNIVRLDEGLLSLISEQIARHPEIKLIIIDTFQFIRGKILPGEKWYEYDYREASQIKEFIDKNSLSAVLVHHTSKSKDKRDPFNDIGGTNGITGAMDTMLVLTKGDRNSKDATLSATGRDIEEAKLILKHDANGQWLLRGDAKVLAEREKLLEYRSSPIVKTIKSLLEESKTQHWAGTATALLDEGSSRFNIYLAPTSRALSEELKKFKSLLMDEDGIEYTVRKNGNAGQIHHFQGRLKYINDPPTNH